MIHYSWLVFAGMFALLAGFHFYRATRSIEKMQPLVSGVKSINGVSTGVVEFQKGFGGFIDKFNRENHWINIVTGMGYSITAVTALFSFFLF